MGSRIFSKGLGQLCQYDEKAEKAVSLTPTLGLWLDVEAVSSGCEVRGSSHCLQGRCEHGSICRLPADTATEPLTFPEDTGWERGIQATGQTAYSGCSCGEVGAQQQGLSLQNPRTTPRSEDMKERVGSVGQPHLWEGERV